MHDTHVISIPSQARQVIRIDDDSPLISVVGKEGIEDVNIPLGITSKYDDNKVRKSGKSTNNAKIEGGTHDRSKMDDMGVSHNKY